jgi:periplasmic protein TonB
MDKHFTPPPPRAMFAPEPLSVRLRRWRPDGIQVGVIASALLHAAVFGAVGLYIAFVGVPDFNRVFQETPLEVVLVNARSKEAPTKAQAIAQATLAGGGEAEAGLATSPLPPSPSSLPGDQDTEAARAIQQMQAEQQQLLTQLRREIAQMPVPDPRKLVLTQAERQQEQQRQQKLRTLAAIEKRVNEENSRPRRRYISPSTREEVYAVYYDALRHKIEERGTRDFPTLNGHKLYGELTMNLTIDAQGRIVEAEIERSSNSRWLDQRAIAIARAAAPFGHFSDDMRRNADQIVVTSRFRFTKSDGLETTLTTSGG